MINVLFVCLGNICRSPMAEGIFKKIVADAGLSEKIQSDSAGIIGYHAGELPDSRMRQTAKKQGIILSHRSRQLSPQDFTAFNYILGMDENNMQGIRQMAEHSTNKETHVFKMREFDDQSSNLDVEDPYYQQDIGFDICYKVLSESCQNFLNYLIKEYELVI